MPFYCDFKRFKQIKNGSDANMYNPPRFTTAAAKFGLDHENEVLACYQDTLKSRGENAEVTKCGFVMNSEKGYLGATPDATGTLANGNQAIVEMKCPPTFKDKTVQESINDYQYPL